MTASLIFTWVSVLSAVDVSQVFSFALLSFSRSPTTWVDYFFTHENCQLFTASDFSVALSRACITEIEESSCSTAWKIFLLEGNSRRLVEFHSTPFTASCDALLGESEAILQLVLPVFTPLPWFAIRDALTYSPALNSPSAAFAYASLVGLLDGPSNSRVRSSTPCVIEDKVDSTFFMEISDRRIFKLNCSQFTRPQQVNLFPSENVAFTVCEDFARLMDVANLCAASTDLAQAARYKNRSNSETAVLQGLWDTELGFVRSRYDATPRWSFLRLRCGRTGLWVASEIIELNLSSEIARIEALLNGDEDDMSHLTAEERSFLAPALSRHSLIRLVNDKMNGYIQKLRLDHGSGISLEELCTLANNAAINTTAQNRSCNTIKLFLWFVAVGVILSSFSVVILIALIKQ